MADKYIVGTGLWSDVAGNGVGGGTPVAQSGDMQFGAGGGINMDIANPNRCMTSSVVNRHMTLVTTKGCNGYAVVSSGV